MMRLQWLSPTEVARLFHMVRLLVVLQNVEFLRTFVIVLQGLLMQLSVALSQEA